MATCYANVIEFAKPLNCKSDVGNLYWLRHLKDKDWRSLFFAQKEKFFISTKWQL